MGLSFIINSKLYMQLYGYFITQKSSTVLVKNNNFTLSGGSQNFSKRTAVNTVGYLY
jgi:hypothetical protein